MKLNKKAFMIAGAAAMFTIGAAIPSFAAAGGWATQGDSWCYLDAQGNKVTNVWKKSGNDWYYLDSDGLMATDTWVDDTSYVDIYGVRVTNRWIYTEAGTDNAPNSEGGWYYLDAAGKAVTDGWKTINSKKYYFDSDGTMKYGWYTDGSDTYYLGDENNGTAATGWLCLDFDKDNLPDDGDVSEQETTGSDTAKWFYFLSNGKAVKADNDTYTSKTISGKKYYFDSNGVMLTGWVSMTSEGDSSDVDPTGISSFKYFGDDNDGQMSKGWKYLSDFPEDSDDSSSIVEATSSNAQRYGSSEGNGSWYYFDSNGKPKYLCADATSMSKATVRINGQSYFFDEYGKMQYGLVGIDFGDGTEHSAYFGNSESDGKMRTDKQTSVTEDSGDRSTFFFETSGSDKGAGVSGDKKGYLYYNGKLVTADKGTTTQVFEVNDKLYLVNESGQIQKSNKCYKSDGDYRYEIANGKLYEIDADKTRLGKVTSGETLPEISFKDTYNL